MAIWEVTYGSLQMKYDLSAHSDEKSSVSGRVLQVCINNQ